MRVGILFLFFSIGILQAENSYSQSARITLSIENERVADILEAVELQSDFTFVYDSKVVDTERKASINVNDEKVFELLEQLFLDTDVAYTVVNNKIVLNNKEDVISSQQSDKLKVAGTVTDSEGVTLPGAVVIARGEANNVATADMEGRYTITINEGTELEFSYIGYETQVINPNGKSAINVILAEDSEMLEEVVVVGYGVQKKANLTGSIATASAKDLKNKAATNLLEGLQGVIPNFNVGYASGDPGVTPELSVRGYASLTGGSPLIIIDGVQSDSYILTRMNMEDVESFTVLKDAAASAIYGARAAFGVVLITTKRGTKNSDKTRITFSSSAIGSTPIFTPDLVNAYEMASSINEGLRRNGSPPRFAEEHLEKMRLYHENPSLHPIDEQTPGGDYYFYGTVDYIDECLNKSALRLRNNVNISGGTKRSDYYISAGYTKDEGFFKYNNQEIDIFSIKTKINTEITDWMSVGINTDFIKEKQSIPHMSYPSNRWETIYGQRIYFNIKNPMNDHYTYNPVGLLKEGGTDHYEDTNNVLSFNAKFTPIKGWNIYAMYTYRETTKSEDLFSKEMYFADNFGYRFPKDALWTGWIDRHYMHNASIKSSRNVYDIYSDYELSLGDHNLKFMVGYNQEDFHYEKFYAEKEGVINSDLPSINLATGEDHVGQEAYHWGVRGAFYRINYDYDNKYLFEANGRYDGTSRFGKDSRFGFFPSFSAAWRIGQEKFMDWAKPLNELKLRASWGSLGNQEVSTYAYIAAMEADHIDYLFDGNRPVGVSPPNLVSETLSWETVNTLNFGLDFALLENRIAGSFDWFNRQTLDMLISGNAMPGILGADAPEHNSADLSTKGWELALNWRDHKGDFSYGVGFTLSDSRTFITKYDNPTNSLSKWYKGAEIGEIWGYETEGFIETEEKRDFINNNQTQIELYNGSWRLGDIEYKDLDGDGKITRGDYTLDNPGDLKVIGNSQSRYNYGLNLSFSWRELSFSAFFHGSAKRDFMPERYLFWPLSNTYRNLMTNQMDTWTPDNPDAYFPQMTAGGDRNFENQTKYIQNAAYIRLKNISISYSIPQKVLEKTFLEEVSFFVSGRNLWEYTTLREPFDPEGTVEDGNIFPYKREFAFGITIGF